MRNNKIVRARAQRISERLAKSQAVAVLDDGTEVLKTRESRAKVRRWSFEADIQLLMPNGKNEDGTNKPGIELPPRVVKLDAISYCTAREAVIDSKHHEEDLRNTNQLFAISKIHVRAIPHETVSNTTVNQMTGYRDMAMVLDKALAIAITDSQLVVSGSSVGSQFVEKAAIEANEELGIKAEPARTLPLIKEEFYKRALAEIKASMEKSNGESSSDTGKSNDGNSTENSIGGQAAVECVGDGEERKSFVPEIVEVQRSAGHDGNDGTTEENKE